MNAAEKLQKAVEDYWRENQSSGHRYHLGASIVGRSCMREVWYKFRWWHTVKHSGRMLRLFERGHLEEPRVVRDLRNIGVPVKAVDDSGQQATYSGLWGLFGGQCDGALSGLEAYGLDGEGLLEVKTHGDKSFSALKSKGLLTAKPEHFVQMQLYMSWFGMLWGLYCAVNKNTDEYYFAVVPYRPEIAAQYTERARQIITATLPPKRISDDPTWYVCRFCDMKRHCHGDTTERTDGGVVHALALPDKNCRTCQFVTLEREDEENTETGHAWWCKKWGQEIPKEFTRQGCDQWVPLSTS